MNTSLFGKKDNLKNLIFIILTKEYPLKIIQLTNYIKKRYARSVTFQGVRCAILELMNENILIRNKNSYSINKEWVLENKRFLDNLYTDLQKKPITPKGVDSITGEISVFNFNSINELTIFWQDIIYDLFKQKTVLRTHYQAAHLWEGLIHSDREKRLMTALKKKKIKAFILSTGSSPLDKTIKLFYTNLGVKVCLNPSLSSFDKSYYVGVYGDLIVQTEYPKKVVIALDKFFRQNKTIDKLDINKLLNIVNQKIESKLIVINNSKMAKQIKNSINSQMY
ncbi:MAG: hypothetical protein KAT43_04810 [Nanoarchaeota archaeon]|nr:hypothetical protein [Nanoarchaeota archaeon]